MVGDTVGDPFKDTSGPSLNILLKLMSVVALVIAPSIALDLDPMSEKVENKEHNITFEVNKDTDIADNNITYERVIKN